MKVKCNHCGQSFKVAPSRVKHGRGKHCSKECHYAAQVGEGNPFWRGGTSSEVEVARAALSLQKWKLEVFKRDEFTCRKCGSTESNKLNAHHILSFTRYPEAREVLENGICLCVDCHQEFHRLYGVHYFTDDNLWNYIGEI